MKRTMPHDFDVVEAEHTPYHSGEPSRLEYVQLERREIIVWDGEGITRGEGKPQDYVLFGCSTGEHITSDTRLSTEEILDFIIDVGKRNIGAVHMSYAFNYDANQIVRTLSEKRLRKLYEDGYLTIRKPHVGSYHIQFHSGKWFSVSLRTKDYHRKKNWRAKTTVRIYDIFSFFGKAFTKAYEEFVGPVPAIVEEGKANRNKFNKLGASYILSYWQVEIQMYRELAEELRRRLYGAGLRISQWHGPGALASFAFRQHSMKQHMSQAPKEVREAARYAYAGGRFEIFRLGRQLGPIYGIDINSAYPFGITQLPSLSRGKWLPVGAHPERLARFGVYHVRVGHRDLPLFGKRAGPLFHRDYRGNISFPWALEGWYWSPEVANLKGFIDRGYAEIVEGWEFHGDGTRPFEWVADMYEKRREWKAQGMPAQVALKLCMNSMYGKMAQRVGWDREKMTGPPWHQLEWAGWTTSNTRAMLWRIISRIPQDKLIAVETDGIYTTMNPAELGITNSKELGGWEISEYDEILYVQSGMAWLRKGDTWEAKRRGLDARTFALSDCQSYLRTLTAGPEWEPYSGETTRFIGLGAALHSGAPLKVRHCLWETKNREIQPGRHGKRVHLSGQCAACKQGLSAYDMPHDMSVRSLAYKPGFLHSSPHDIPWENDIEYEWRNYEIELGEVVYDG